MSATSGDIKNCNPSDQKGKVRNIYTGRLVNDAETSRKRMQSTYGSDKDEIVFHRGLAGIRRHIDKCLEIPSKPKEIKVSDKILEIYNKCKERCKKDQACNLETGRCLALDKSGKPKSESTLKKKWGSQYAYDGVLKIVGKRSNVKKIQELSIPSKKPEISVKGCYTGDLRCGDGKVCDVDSDRCISDNKDLMMIEVDGRKMVGRMGVMMKVMEKYPSAKIIRKGKEVLMECSKGKILNMDEYKCVDKKFASDKAQMMINGRLVIGRKSTLEKLRKIYPESKITQLTKTGYAGCIEGEKCGKGKVCDAERGCIDDTSSNKLGKSILKLGDRTIIGKPETIKLLKQKLGGEIVATEYKGKAEPEELLIPTKLPSDIRSREVALTRPASRKVDFNEIISKAIRKGKGKPVQEKMIEITTTKVPKVEITPPEQLREMEKNIDKTFEKCLSVL